jgi:hypothetical protein
MMGDKVGLRPALASLGAVVIAAATLAVAAGATVTAAQARDVPGATAVADTGPAAGGVLAGGTVAGGTVSAVSRVALLITGDRVAVTSLPGRAGPVRVAARLPGGLAGGIASISLGGAVYEVPYAALPYLHRGLDPNLFNLTSLLSAEQGGMLPVVVRFAGRMPALPGITITASGRGRAAGYLTASSARAFGAALGRQFIADHARARYGADGLFGAGTSISLAGSAAGAARAARQGRTASDSGFHLRTLTVSAANLAGRPDTGDFVVVFNIDNPGGDLGEVIGPFDAGIAKFSVPTGHYYALAFFADMTGRNFTDFRITILPQFTVSGDVTVLANEQAADSELAFVTPRPATLFGDTFQISRVPAVGQPIIVGFSFDGPLWVSPTSERPTVGKLATVTSALLFGPGRSPGYFYGLAYQDVSGLVPGQRFQVRASGLATVAARYYFGSRQIGDIQQGAVYPDPVGSALGLFIGFRLPFRSPVEYVTANPSLMWFTTLDREAPASSGFLVVNQQIDARVYRAGQRVREDWNRYPLHPAPFVSPPGTGAFLPQVASASRAGNELTILVTPFSDNVPGHIGSGLANEFSNEPGTRVAGTFEVDQNGVKIAGGDAVQTLWQARLSPRPSVIRFTLDATRAGPAYPLSARTRTVWTWRSAPDRPATLAAPWVCGSVLADEWTRHCSAQPLLWLDYRVSGLGLDGSAPAGRQALKVSVSHFQPSASTARITRVKVRVSFDNGRTWHAASVAADGPGRFLALYTAPRTARYVELRVTAADADRSTVTETLPRAYKIAARSAAGAHAGHPPGAAPRAACPVARPGYARCFALYSPQVRVNRAIAAGLTGAASRPAGWGPAALRSAYKLPFNRNSHQTVAVSIAFDTPRLEQYLAVYRRHYGLPPCTTANGCFRKVNQLGRAKPLPRSGVFSGWDVEATLDVSMISAACPHCHILVVEAKNNLLKNLAATDNTAARLGAQVISNSYGGAESGFTQPLAGAYDHPGHVIVASSGDSGFLEAQFPADLSTVTAAGGTELSRAKNARGWSEQVWNIAGSGAAGSGCSAYVAKPAWQHDTACGMRTSADMSAVADNIAVYNADNGGWLTVAGTSVSAPLIAGIYGLAGNAATIRLGYAYAHARSLFDVTVGNNDWLAGTGGASCGFTDLCVAGKGYDAPTGLGTPDGTGAF